MRKLLEALASWQGPERVGEEIARRGFLVPRLYRREMIGYCRSKGMDSDLESYWSECAKERVFSGGRVDLNHRQFRDGAPYRSTYLDQLMVKRQLRPSSRVPELHPCLRHWIEEQEATKYQSGKLLQDQIDRFKEEECDRIDLTPESWTGKKKDVKPILRRFAERKGFEERTLEVRGFGWLSESGKGKAFCKETPSGLLFHCWVDTGGLPDASGRLPLNFFVSHIEDRFPPLGAGPDSIYVGAEYYARFGTARMAVYGIYALVEIFDAFASTFA